MTRRTLGAGIVTALLAASAAFPQEHDISGAWQGTLHTPRADLRIVMKVSKDASGYKAMMYSIDQGGGGLPSSSITLQGNNIKIVVPALGGVYEGKFSNTDGTA